LSSWSPCITPPTEPPDTLNPIISLLHPRYWLPALFTLSVVTPVPALAEKREKGERREKREKRENEETPAAPEGPQKLPTNELLPHGSQLHGVVIPRHNKQFQLVSSLSADVVTLVNDEMVSGTGIVIDFYGDKGARDARIKLREATFNQSSGMMRASEKVTIDANTYRARGTGLHYALREGRGLLTGPAVTWMDTKPQTAMKTKTPALLGAAGMALVSTTAAQPVPEAPAAAPHVLIRNDGPGPIATARQEAQEKLKKDIEDSTTTDAEVKDFVEKIPLDYEALTGSKPTPPPNQPLKFEPGPEHTVVKCESGMYFDAEKGLLVYLKNVQVDDPQYTLSGADILKIFMAKSEKDPAKDKPKDGAEKPKDGAAQDKPDGKDKDAKENGPVPAVGGNFDSVDKIVATGAVRILQRATKEGEDPVEASGAVFTYHPKTGDIVLSGGYPWVKQGDYFARAMEPNLTLRMKRDGSYVTEGHWEMGGKVNREKKKPEPGN